MAVIRRWTTPSHRPAWEWHKIMWQVARANAWLAEHDMLQAPLVDFDKFITRRVIGAAFSYYRSELKRARLFDSRPPSDFESARSTPALPIPAEIRDPAREIVREVLSALPQGQQKLLELLFFSGFSESEAGDILGISQQEVSRRKRAALLRLRAELESSLTLNE